MSYRNATTRNLDRRRQPTPATPIGCGRRIAVVAVHHLGQGDGTHPSGAEKYLLQTISALLDAGASVHVGYSGSSIYDDLLLRTGRARLTIEHTGWLDEAISGDARLKLRTILARRRWLRAIGADTLFAVQQAGGGAFGATLVAARWLGLRVISSVRQMPQPLPQVEPKRYLGLAPSLHLWRRRLIWRRRLPASCCDALIFNSRTVAEAHAREYGLARQRFRIIPNGELPRPEVSPGPNRPAPCRIATAGRVTDAKGADVLLAAFAEVAGAFPNACLTYFGDGPLIPILQSEARRLGLAERVFFAGYCPDRDALYANVDIYVQPSRRESMSHSVLEAMARGIPCVVTDVGGLPETVLDGTTGFVVPKSRPRACAEALSRLLADRETFARFASASRERVRSFFDLRDRMQETVSVILGPPRRVRRTGRLDHHSASPLDPPNGQPGSGRERATLRPPK